MKPAPPETAELLHRVRQQLILAQVRLMELEDVRDELTPKLADAEMLRTSAQILADQKTDEAGHLASTLADLQAQYEHMRHMQHVTNEALNDSRRELAAATASLAATGSRLTAEEQRTGQLQKEIAALADQAAQSNARLSRVSQELAEATHAAAACLARINELDAQIRTLKASRSWRWTAWLRSLERTFGGRKP